MKQLWAPCDRIALEVLWRAGTHPAEIAELLDRSESSVRAQGYVRNLPAILIADIADRSQAVVGRPKRRVA